MSRLACIAVALGVSACNLYDGDHLKLGERQTPAADGRAGTGGGRTRVDGGITRVDGGITRDGGITHDGGITRGGGGACGASSAGQCSAVDASTTPELDASLSGDVGDRDAGWPAHDAGNPEEEGVDAGAPQADAGLMERDAGPDPDALPAVAINAGGEAYVARDGTPFEGDAHYTGGSATAREPERVIAATEDPALYRVERYGVRFGYTLDLAPGRYLVRLQFAETWFQGPGLRIFDVMLEGERVIDDVDLYAVAGESTAHIRTFIVEVQDDTLDVQLEAELDNAVLSALSVWRLP